MWRAFALQQTVVNNMLNKCDRLLLLQQTVNNMLNKCDSFALQQTVVSMLNVTVIVS